MVLVLIALKILQIFFDGLYEPSLQQFIYIEVK
jgi:hypothetical protein